MNDLEEVMWIVMWIIVGLIAGFGLGIAFTLILIS